MLRELAPLCDALVLTATRNPRALPPPTLASRWPRRSRGTAAETVADPTLALARARELAGRDGVVVVAPVRSTWSGSCSPADPAPRPTLEHVSADGRGRRSGRALR